MSEKPPIPIDPNAEPSLALTLIEHADASGTLPRLLTPDQVGGDYLKFCQALNLEHLPNLMIVGDDSKGLEKGVRGSYSARQNLVTVPQSVYDSFVHGNAPKDRYYVAHELGHAKSSQALSRRHFLGKAAKYVAGGAVALGTSQGVLAARKSLDRDTDTPPDQPETKWTHAIRAVSLGGLAGMMTAAQLGGLLARAEEFRADTYARTILPQEERLDAFVHATEEGLTLDGKTKELDQLRATFEEAMGNLPAEQSIDPTTRKVGWALVLNSACTVKMPLKSYVKAQYYPTMVERLDRELSQPDRFGR